MFSRYEFIAKMADCFNYHHSSFKVQNKDKFYTIIMEDSNFLNGSCDIAVFEISKGFIPILQFWQIKYDDNNEIQKVMDRIENEISPKQKSLEEIIEDYENGKIDFKECNRQAKELEDR